MLMAVALIVASCSENDAATPIPTDTGVVHHSEQSAAQEPAMTAIQMIIDGRTVAAELTDSPTARELAGQHPITLTFRDFNEVEKIAKLPRPLTIEGVPEGDDPEVADIGYYSPSQDLDLYYGDVGYWNGIVRIGRFNTYDLDFVKRQPDEFRVAIESA